MVINSLTIVYWVITVLVLLVAVPAALVGLVVARRWRPGSDLEERHELENWVYLAITLVAVGLSLRLVLVPLWFLTLSSLISHLPGAMCLAGVHLLDSPWSFVATSLKVVVPLFYGYWLALNALDRRIEEQPLMRRKLLLLAPIALLVLIESYLDLRLLTAVRPMSVSCCTSLFDMPTTPVAKVVSSSSPVWIWTFAALAVGVVGLARLVARSPTLSRRAALVVAAAGALATFVLALHTGLSPLLLRAPFHHCVFCAVQMAVDVQLASGLIITGLWLAGVMGMLPAGVEQNAHAGMVRRLMRWSAASLVAGTILLSVRTGLTVLSS